MIPIDIDNQHTDSVAKPPRRRLYFPTYGKVFPLWMCNETICKEFLRLFINKGALITSISKPESEVDLQLGGKVHGVRFDVMVDTGASREANDYHIYCVDCQRDFQIKSFADRTIYYGCTAIAAKSLAKNESYEKLRPVTIVFIYIDQQATTDFIDEIVFYRASSIKRDGASASPYSDKLSFVEINLNNKANMVVTGSLHDDMRAFVDLMTHGDDNNVVCSLKSNPKLSKSMREVVNIFGNLMSVAIQEKRVNESEFPSELGEVLEREVYKMTFQDLLAQRAAEAKAETDFKVKRDIARKMLINKEDIDKITDYTGLTEDEVLQIRSEVNEAIEKRNRDIAKEMLADGEDIAKIVKYTKLTEIEVLKIRSELNLPDAI